MSPLYRFLAELQRRRVYRVSVAYAVAGLGALEGIDVLTSALGLPHGLVTATAVLALLGFPVALFLAWRYQLTPEGVERTLDGEAEVPAGPVLPTLAVVAAIAFVGFAVGWLVHSGPSGARLDGDGPVAIAVLPFTNLSGPDDAYFTDGLHEEIIGRLSGLESFRVTSRTSVMRYRDEPQPIPRIAADLGVQAVLEGSVRRAGNTLRMTTQLIDATRDEHLWSANFDREYSLEAVLEIQSEVATEVASALRVALDPSAHAATPTGDLAAYDLYLLGRHHWNARTPEDLRRAISLFEQALERDPDFAQAWAGLASAYAVQAAYDDTDAHESMPRAKEAASQALQRDSTLAEAYATLGFVAFTYDWDPTSAGTYFDRALENNPSHAPALYWRGWYLGLVGRAEESRASLERAVKLAPLSVAALYSAGSAYMLNGAFDEARATLTRATELDPSFAPAWSDLGSTEYMAGRLGAAADAWARFLAAWGRAGDAATVLADLENPGPDAVADLHRLLPPAEMSASEALLSLGLFSAVGDSATVPALIARVQEASLPGLPRLYQLPFLTPFLDLPETMEVSRRFRARFGLGP